MKEYNLPTGAIAEKWVSDNWKTTEDEYYLQDRDDGTLYHFFQTYGYWTMRNLGFSEEDIADIRFILAPDGEDNIRGDVSTWHLYNSDGDEVYAE